MQKWLESRQNGAVPFRLAFLHPAPRLKSAWKDQQERLRQQKQRLSNGVMSTVNTAAEEAINGTRGSLGRKKALASQISGKGSMPRIYEELQFNNKKQFD